MKITLNKEARYRIVHIAAQEYMTQNNPMFNPETVEKVSKTQLQSGMRQRNFEKLIEGHRKLRRNSVTSPQQAIYDAMTKVGIGFVPEYLVKSKFIVDAAIPDANLIIQVDGCYWHGHSCRFDNLTKRQKKQQRRDRAQDKYLTICGWAVIRFWECEINSNIEACINQVTDNLDGKHN